MRPPSVDSLARSIAHVDLPQPLLVDVARAAIADNEVERVEERAIELRRTLLQPVINATGVLLHTNLGRAPLQHTAVPAATNLEFDLTTGRRGSRQASVGRLVARLSGAEAAMVVNNNAAAVLLVLAAIAGHRQVLVSRGESVEIGGAFRIPEVLRQSGARLVDVGTTNRTRLSDFREAMGLPDADVAMVMKIHPSNYRIEGFVEQVDVQQLATLDVPVVADIGSGLLDASCPWLPGGPPPWLKGEPAARQSLSDGASIVTFSGDKLLGGPQAGILAGRADLIAKCARHPLARALRPGALVLAALQDTLLAYLRRDAHDRIPFWRMASAPVELLRDRAAQIVAKAGLGRVEDMESVPGAGSLPGAAIPSAGIVVAGDHQVSLRQWQRPVIARVRDGNTFVDLRTVDVRHDDDLVDALRTLSAKARAG
jgi:L-seryl-tRNA(Ser) seleniumtransferase